MLTLHRTTQILNYDPESGLFTWKLSINRRIKAGQLAGSGSALGYRRIKIDGKQYLAHRVAWLLYYGSWPVGQIDHIDTNRSNNSITNLRECTASQNQHNQPARKSNRSGFKGVSWCSTKRKWHVQARTPGKVHQGGYFDCLNEAAIAAESLRKTLHGEFARN